MTVRIGESNKIIRVSSGGVSMATNTNLGLAFVAPTTAGTNFSRDESSSPNAVALGTTLITDPTLGPLAANTYVNYLTGATDFNEAGTWQVQLTWTDTGTTPDTIIIGTCAKIALLAQVCT